MRIDGRKSDELRPINVTSNYTDYAEGSVLIEVGQTRLLCNTTIENNIPRWMQSEKRIGGWITAEYGMLPRSTHQRTSREASRSSGRTHEIRRLIGRSLRSAVNLEKLGQRTCIIDCDVIQADGGTRTAAITGGYLSLVIALRKLINSGELPSPVHLEQVAAISVGILNGTAILDLCYDEDVRADVDANIVMVKSGQLIEVQISAEHKPFSHSMLDPLLNLAYKGIGELFAIQEKLIHEIT